MKKDYEDRQQSRITASPPADEELASTDVVETNEDITQQQPVEEEFKASVIEPTPTGEELAQDDVQDTEALIEMVRTQQSNLDLAVANQAGMVTP